MPIYDPSMTPARAAAEKRAKLAALKAVGLSPRTAQSVIDEMLEVLDVDRLPGTVAEVKRRWSAYFPPPRSADVIASRTRR